jgi:hypothetical protein
MLVEKSHHPKLSGSTGLHITKNLKRSQVSKVLHS